MVLNFEEGSELNNELRPLSIQNRQPISSCQTGQSGEYGVFSGINSSLSRWAQKVYTYFLSASSATDLASFKASSCSFKRSSSFEARASMTLRPRSDSSAFFSASSS